MYTCEARQHCRRSSIPWEWTAQSPKKKKEIVVLGFQGLEEEEEARQINRQKRLDLCIYACKKKKKKKKKKK